MSSIILVAHASILLYSHTSPICGLSSSCRGRTMHEVDFLPFPQLLFVCISFSCVLIVIALAGPDWPWRCYLFKCSPHILSHVRLFLQIQVTRGAFLHALARKQSNSTHLLFLAQNFLQVFATNFVKLYSNLMSWSKCSFSAFISELDTKDTPNSNLIWFFPGPRQGWTRLWRWWRQKRRGRPWEMKLLVECSPKRNWRKWNRKRTFAVILHWKITDQNTALRELHCFTL